ncbi:MAG: glycosyltransferase [Microcoleaceae cyanobacterium]
MKIAILCHLDYPIASPFAGGLEAHTWHLCQSLIRQGHEVTMFASGDSDPYLNLFPVTEMALQKLPSMTSAERNAIKSSIYQETLQIIQSEGFDLIHNNSLNIVPLLEAYRLNIPVVTVLHTPPFDTLAAAAKTANQLSNTYFVAVSKTVASQWESYVDSQVIYNGIEIDQWPFSAEAIPKTAIWFGRFVPEKSPHEAILAARLAGFTIKLAGPISDVDYFQEKVEPLLEDEQVQYLGHLSHQQLGTVIGQSAVFVKTPQWQEPYGLVYAESLACGTPVATFDRGAGKEILTLDCGRVVACRSIEVLAAAIQAAAQLSRWACRQRAEEFCQLSQMISAYEHLYRRAILPISPSMSPLPTAA